MTSREKSKAVNNSQGGLMIWHGMTCSGVWRLFRFKPLLHWTRLHRILSLPFSGVYNSVMKRVESVFYGRRVRNTKIEHPPLFVLGYWRSGTTLLQTLLSRDPQFQHLGLYRALFPWHFLLTEKIVTTLTAPFVPENRPMDNIKVSWDAPQEDDMSLCIMAQVSSCMLLSHPHDPSQFWRALKLDELPPEELKRWKDALMLLVKKQTFASSKRIMMKSPIHTYHIPTLLEMFPDARFLYIHRDPYNVFRSSCHLRRRMIDENTLGRSIYQDVEEEIISTYRYGFEKYEKDRELIPKGRLHEISFEEMEKDPVRELRTAYEELDLPGFDELEKALQPELESLKQYKKNEFQDDPYWVTRVYDDLRPAFERFGYQKPGTVANEQSNEQTNEPTNV